jgi:type II secretion system protein G
MKTDLVQIRRWIFLILLFGFALGCRRSGTHGSKPVSDSLTIAAAVKSYHMMTGKLPTTEQGLNALINRPDDLPPEVKWVVMFKKIPTDPWGVEYEYTLLSTDNDPKFEIRSLGPDGIRSEDDIVSTH